jgi:hypothetical protein
MTATRHTITEALLRIQDAFLDTPGLMLTLQDAKLLFGVDEPTCAAILQTLTDSKVLALTRSGAYVRQFPMTHAA